MNMRFLFLIGFLVGSMPFLKAQNLKLLSAQEGHTGFRGAMPVVEDHTTDSPEPQNTAPIEGVNYYRLTCKVLKNSTLKPGQLRVNRGGKSYKLPLQLPNKQKVQTAKAGEVVVLYAEWPQKASKIAPLSPLKKGEAQAVFSANGRLQTLSVSSFDLIMPE